MWESEASLTYLKSCLKTTEARTSDKKKHQHKSMSENTHAHTHTCTCALPAHSGPSPDCVTE